MRFRMQSDGRREDVPYLPAAGCEGLYSHRGSLLPLLLAGSLQAAAPSPSVTLSAPALVRLGDPLAISATFDNTSPDTTGYGPFIDIVVDTTGTDGVIRQARPDPRNAVMTASR